MLQAESVVYSFWCDLGRSNCQDRQNQYRLLPSRRWERCTSRLHLAAMARMPYAVGLSTNPALGNLPPSVELCLCLTSQL
eukprot:SAG31_NODE_1897_length_6964_cov_2.677349_6_plen_80_part_00